MQTLSVVTSVIFWVAVLVFFVFVLTALIFFSQYENDENHQTRAAVGKWFSIIALVLIIFYALWSLFKFFLGPSRVEASKAVITGERDTKFSFEGENGMTLGNYGLFDVAYRINPFTNRTVVTRKIGGLYVGEDGLLYRPNREQEWKDFPEDEYQARKYIREKLYDYVKDGKSLKMYFYLKDGKRFFSIKALADYDNLTLVRTLSFEKNGFAGLPINPPAPQPPANPPAPQPPANPPAPPVNPLLTQVAPSSTTDPSGSSTSKGLVVEDILQNPEAQAEALRTRIERTLETMERLRGEADKDTENLRIVGQIAGLTADLRRGMASRSPPSSAMGEGRVPIARARWSETLPVSRSRADESGLREARRGDSALSAPAWGTSGLIPLRAGGSSSRGAQRGGLAL